MPARLPTCAAPAFPGPAGLPITRGAPTHLPAAIRRLNNQVLRLRDRFPDFYTPGIQVHPHFPAESCREIERCRGREGVRWIGELAGYIMGYGDDYASEAALTVMRGGGAHGAAVNLHCNDLNTLDRLCTILPGLKIVLAHPGGGKQDILARLAMVARHANLHLDISGSGIDRLGLPAMRRPGRQRQIAFRDGSRSTTRRFTCMARFTNA